MRLVTRHAYMGKQEVARLSARLGRPARVCSCVLMQTMAGMSTLTGYTPYPYIYIL